MNAARPSWAWAAMAALLAVPAACVGVVTPESTLVLHLQAFAMPADLPGLWSAAWAHLSARHLQLNVLAAAGLGLAGMVARMGRADAGAWLLAWPLTHALMLLEPRLDWYAGASGVMHAGLAVLGMALLRRGHALLAGATLLALCGKVGRDVLAGYPLAQLSGSDIPVATLSHLTGTLAGLTCATLLAAGIHQARLPARLSGAFARTRTLDRSRKPRDHP